MANMMYRIHVKYTNVSEKTSKTFAVIAESQADAVKMLFEGDQIGSDLASFEVSLAPYDAIIIPPYSTVRSEITIINQS